MPGRKVTKADKEWLKQKKAERQAYLEEKKYQDESVAASQRRLKSQEAFNASLEGTNDLEKTLLKNSNSINASVAKRGDVHQQVLDTMQAQADEGALSEAQSKSQVKFLEKIASGQADINDIMQFQKDNAEEMTGEFAQFLKTEIAHKQALEASAEVMESMDTLTGGMASKIGDFSKIAKNPAMMGAAALTAAVGLLVSFSSNLDAIGEQFGAIGVQQFAGDLMQADAEMAKLGYDAGSAAEVTTELADNFGIGMSDAMGMAVAVGDMSKALGLSLAEGSQLVGMFTSIGGMSPQQAEDTAKMAAQLAAANDVNPSAVLKDIAGSTETFAKFGQDGGKNLVEAAVVAKKLGTNLDSVAGTMESMLNFADSTSKAMEASVMIGRDINVQKLQELSLAGDAAGVLEEQKRLLGDQEKWNSMNVLQRKALAEALGLSVEEANKMVNAEAEAAELSGDLSKQKGFNELVGEEAMSNMTEMLNSIKAIGASLTKIFGPALNAIITPLSTIVGWVSSFVEVIDRTVGVMPVLIGLLTAYAVANRKAGIAAAKATIKTVVGAVANIWKAMSSMSAATLGFGTPVALALGAGAVATIIASMMMAKSKKVGDAMIPGEGGGPVVSSPKVGGMFQGAPQDDVLMGPGLAAATGGGGGGGAEAIVGAITGLQQTTQQGIDSRPSAKDIGKRTGKTLEQLGDG